MRDTAQIIRPQQKEEAKFICSSCGADRGCNCNAPAVEKLAAIKEQARQRDRAYKERKRQEKQQSGDVADNDIEKDRQECVALYQKAKQAEEELAQYSATKQGEPMQTEQAPVVDEGKILNKFASEIIAVGYKTLAEQFHYDKQTMIRLAKARDGLRRLEWF